MAETKVTPAEESTNTLGYSQLASSFTTTAVSTSTDVTGLSVAATVPTGGRAVKITGQGSLQTTAGAGTQMSLIILRGSTVIQQQTCNEPISGYAVPFSVVGYDTTVSAGANTYKIAVVQSGAGTLTVQGDGLAVNAHGFASILVENG